MGRASSHSCSLLTVPCSLCTALCVSTISPDKLVSRSEYRGLDRLEYYLPIIRFHNRWDELEPWVFGVDSSATRLSFANHSFGQGVHDIPDELVLDNDVREPIPGDIGAVFGELLDYCDAEHVNVLFVKSPQADSLKEQGRMNALEDVLESRGYPCLDLLEDFHKTGLDPAWIFTTRDTQTFMAR